MLRMRYRHKVRLRKIGRALLIALGALILGLVVILVYADSLVTYNREGAFLVTEATELQGEDTSAKERPVISNPIIEIREGAVVATEIVDVGGIYITTSMLKDIDKVTELVKDIEEPCAVYIELKSDFGNFYYTSTYAHGNYPDGIEVSKVDALLTYLETNGFYMIASVPAFPDRAYVLENEELCLREKGGYGWMDSRGCYWLDPSNDAVVSRLMQMARELADRGFREIAFTSFQFPKGDGYVYGSDKGEDQVLSDAAAEISEHMAKNEIVVSFVTGRADFPVAGGRVYISGVDGSQAEYYVDVYSGVESCREVVFMTNSKDARFEKLAVLKPLMAE